MSTSKQPPWCYFSWNLGPRCIKSFNWINEPIPLTGNSVPDVLKNAKNSIETCGPPYLWNFAKKIINPYELVYTYKKNNIPKSLSMHVPLSRSYFKMIEILQITDYFKSRPSKISLTTAHVCEGPGGFIEAIYEAANRNGIKIKDTNAMTLKSSKPHIPGWRRAQQFLQRHRQVKIEYGPDNTGDILVKENRTEFIRKTGKVNIFTADGGFDFTADYLGQEKHVFPLLIASISIGLSVLNLQGFFVVKIFDFFENSTQQLLTYLSTVFEKWSIYKPATSRPCNSEQYFIGQGYRGAKESDIAALERLIEFGQMPEKIYNDLPIEIYQKTSPMLIEKQNFAMETQIDFLKKAQNLVVNWTSITPSGEILQQLWNNVLKNSIKFCRDFKVYHYNINDVKCELILPDPSDCNDELYSISGGGHSELKDEIVEAKSVLLNVCPQSSKPDAVLEIPVPSAPTSESSLKVDLDLPQLESS